MDYQPLLEKIRKEIEIYAHEGKQADYIPALANVNPDQFGLCLRMLDGRTYRLGESDVKFSIQSIAKVFSLAIALSILVGCPVRCSEKQMLKSPIKLQN